MLFSHELMASLSYECIELERVTVANSGLMTPAYPGRTIKFTLGANKIEASGVFYHNEYDILLFKDSRGNTGFKAFATSKDRQDIFHFFEGQLFHSAIVNYGESPSIQSEIFECEEVSKIDL